MKMRLSLNEISVKFARMHILNELSFDLSSGEFLGLIGPNGAGKTTALNVISGLVRPDSGEVTIDGVNVTDAPAWKIQHLGVGRVFQAPQLLPDLTVLRNIEIAVERRGFQHLSTAGTFVPARDLLSRLGILALCLKRPGQLTLFERRLVELGRALVNGPRLLLLDEPGAGCTESERNDYMQKVLELRPRDCSVILIEHDFQTIERFSDRVVLMDDGRVVANASCVDLIKDPILRRVYLGEHVAEHK